MGQRIYCDACDRDVSDEAHVRLVVEVPLGLVTATKNLILSGES
jgi:hypothetical protein